MNKVCVFFIIIGLFAFTNDSQSFKADQKQYARVRQAYADKELVMKKNLEKHGVEVAKLSVYMRVFKKEGILELWGKNSTQKTYILLKTFPICQSSGTIGPKRKEGDNQVPEGFYHISVFNPVSNFYLSMMVNYPNKSDKILSKNKRLGGNICIHGACVTIGCVPLTDDGIKELYIYCVEATNNGQTKIPVTFFPSKLDTKSFDDLQKEFYYDTNTCNLWKDLKKVYDVFNTTKSLPSISFLDNGRCQVL